MVLQEDIVEFLTSKGVQQVYFVDLSCFDNSQTLGFSKAILFTIALTPDYIQKVQSNPNYVKDMIRDKEVDQDEFHLTELKTDRLANELAEWIVELGGEAYSQSEKNLETTHRYNLKEHRTPLPHKSIALRAGLGWIGKHDLLVTPQYGSAFSMCSVLTNEYLETRNEEPQQSQCGHCHKCVDVCASFALQGVNWSVDVDRDKIVDISKCTTCIQCMMACPYTQRYAT